MNTLNIKIKSDRQVVTEKNLPPPRLSYSYIQPVIGSNRSKVYVICQEKVVHEVHQHGISSTNEVGGILVGEVHKWAGKYYVMVNACIPGDHMETGRTHARFTADTWAQLTARREALYPTKVIVGWYHSHPSIGIFLSHMDLEIHKNFFKSPWHIAIVVDAQNNNIGFFGWDGTDILPIKRLLVPSQQNAPGRYMFSTHNWTINYLDKVRYKVRPAISDAQSYSWINFFLGMIVGIGLYHFILRKENLAPKKKTGA